MYDAICIFFCRSSVNGNGTTTASYHTEETTVPAAAPVLVKEPKVKVRCI